MKLGLTTIVPSFILSELNKAFTMGFLIFIPFLIIDLVGVPGYAYVHGHGYAAPYHDCTTL